MKKRIVCLILAAALLACLVPGLRAEAATTFKEVKLTGAQLQVGYYNNTNLTGDVILHCANTDINKETKNLVDDGFSPFYWSKPYIFDDLVFYGGSKVPAILIDVANGGEPTSICGFEMYLRAFLDCVPYWFEIQATTAENSTEWIKIFEDFDTAPDWNEDEYHCEFDEVTVYKVRILFYDIGDPDFASDAAMAYSPLPVNSTRLSLSEINLLTKRDASNTPTQAPAEPAVITTQPKTAKVKASGTAKFTVAATGDGLTYQWQSSTDGKTWKDCSSTSATKASFSFASKTSHDGNFYRCKVTDSSGNTVYTDTVRLYVLGITSQPSTLKVKSGTTAKFTVAASGTGKTYQWQSSTDGKTWKNCSSSTATKTTFSFTSKTSHNGNYYRCRVKDNAGNTVYTDAVRLYVLGVTTQPKTQKVEAGDTVKFTVKATGASLKYQWQSSTNGKTWKNCSSTSATKATFSFAGKTSHNGNYYRCRVTDSKGNVVYTDTVRLYVLGITEQPVSKTVSKGKTAKFTVEATGASKVYQWQCSTDGGKTWKNCSSSSATKATFSFTTKTSHSGNYYRCRIKDSGGNTIYTNKVKLTVK